MGQDDFISSVLKKIYMYKGHPTVWNHLHSHQVSVFFFVLAVGASYVEEATAQATAEKYAALGKAALGVESYTKGATTFTIISFFALIQFYAIAHGTTSYEERWMIGAMMIRLGYSVCGFMLFLQLLLMRHIVVDRTS